MTGSKALNGWNYWRIARWAAAAALLLTPLIMMQISDEWRWEFGSFILAGVLIGGVGVLYELAEKATGNRAYRAGAAIALIVSLLTVWTAIVRDDGNGMDFFMLIMAAVVGGFAAWFGPAGMSRTMSGVAIMQLLVGMAIATGPSTENTPGASSKALIFSGFFAALWVTSAILFRSAAKGNRTVTPSH